MTAVGKILVFFNLIFSLVVGAFVVVVYISQAHWAADYNELSQRYQVLDASNAAYQKQLAQSQDYTKTFTNQVLHDQDLEKMVGLQKTDDFKTQLEKIKTTLATALKDAADQKKAAKDANDALVAAQQQSQVDRAALGSARAESDKHLAEAKGMHDLIYGVAGDNTKPGLLKKNLDLVALAAKEKDDRVAATIRAASFEQRATQLEKENDHLARDNQRLVANGGATIATSLKPNGVNPPLDNVEGMISEVDPSGLVRITIGSDAGLAKGNTLEVYRLNTQVPDQSKYLGRIKLINVRNTEAVGQLMGKPAVPPQPGDTVSSKITGG